jgi:hypothetical protein
MDRPSSSGVDGDICSAGSGTPSYTRSVELETTENVQNEEISIVIPSTKTFREEQLKSLYYLNNQ